MTTVLLALAGDDAELTRVAQEELAGSGCTGVKVAISTANAGTVGVCDVHVVWEGTSRLWRFPFNLEASRERMIYDVRATACYMRAEFGKPSIVAAVRAWWLRQGIDPHRAATTYWKW